MSVAHCFSLVCQKHFMTVQLNSLPGILSAWCAYRSLHLKNHGRTYYITWLMLYCNAAIGCTLLAMQYCFSSDNKLPVSLTLSVTSCSCLTLTYSNSSVFISTSLCTSCETTIEVSFSHQFYEGITQNTKWKICNLLVVQLLFHCMTEDPLHV